VGSWKLLSSPASFTHAVLGRQCRVSKPQKPVLRQTRRNVECTMAFVSHIARKHISMLAPKCTANKNQGTVVAIACNPSCCKQSIA